MNCLGQEFQKVLEKHTYIQYIQMGPTEILHHSTTQVVIDCSSNNHSYTCSSVREGRLIRLAMQPPSVRVSRTFVNLRIMSSTSVRLKKSVICSQAKSRKTPAKAINRPSPEKYNYHHHSALQLPLIFVSVIVKLNHISLFKINLNKKFYSKCIISI